jgi:hypothetical protein
MNARLVVKMSAVALLLAPAWVLAQPLDRRQILPDLVPADVTVGVDCRIVVTLKNNGPGIVPNSGFSQSPPASSGVQMYNDGAPWGGIVLGALDPSHSIQPAGGTVSYTWFPGLALPPGTHEIKVDVDNNNTIAESNERNNSLTKKLSCQKPLPDLVPTSITLQSTGITLNSPCQIVITLKNNGNAIVPDAAFAQTAQGPVVQMYNDGAPWGGAVLGIIDLAKATQPPGGTLVYPWMAATPNLKVAPGTHVLRVDVDKNNSVVESNEANNSLTQSLTCGSVILPPTIR